MIPRYRAWLKEDKEMIDVEEIHSTKCTSSISGWHF